MKKKLLAVIAPLVFFALLGAAANTFITQNLIVQQTSNLAVASATSLTMSGGGSPPLVQQCNASPPSSAANDGSICLDPTAGALWVRSAGAWAQLLTVAPGKLWVNNYQNALNSLAGWTQRAGTWTITGGKLQVDDGVNESYLSQDGGGLGLGNPYNTLCAAPGGTCLPQFYGISVNVTFTAGATSATDCGFVLRGNQGVSGNGFVRVFVQKDGTKVGVDVFGGSQFLWASYPGGAIPAGVTHKLWAYFDPLQATTTGSITIGIDNQALAQGPLNVSFGGLAATTDGPWGNPGHCIFDSWNVWTPAPPS